MKQLLLVVALFCLLTLTFQAQIDHFPNHLQGASAFEVTTILNVTSTVDKNDGVCDADCSLREAVIVANRSVNPMILIPTGRFELSITGAGEDAGFTGDLDISSHTIIRGAGQNETIIDANGIDRVFEVHNIFASFQSLSITGGVADKGGGMRFNKPAHPNSDNTIPLLASANVYGNRALQDGGGVWINTATNATDILRIAGTKIHQNNANNGGGLWVELTRWVWFMNTTVIENSAGSMGGGVYGNVEANWSSISINNAHYGGGLAGHCIRFKIVPLAQTMPSKMEVLFISLAQAAALFLIFQQLFITMLLTHFQDEWEVFIFRIGTPK